MEQNIDKLIEEQFKSLPTELQQAIANSNWGSKLVEIAKMKNLDADQASILETETLLVLYSFESIDDLPKHIAKELAIDNKAATELSALIEEKIIFTTLQKANEGEELLEAPKELVKSDGVRKEEIITNNSQKTKLVPIPIPKPKREYPGGIDPYRESTI